MNRMSNLVEKRNRIRQAVPHLASASGSIASFQTDMRANLEEIKIHFNPVQSGTGTPSPTNVRPITGWTGCDIIISPTQDASLGNQIPVSWSALGTVYGGWVNPVSGEVWATHISLDLSNTNNFTWKYGAGNGSVWYCTTAMLIPKIKDVASSVVGNNYCSALLNDKYSSFSNNSNNDLRICIDTNGRPRLRYNAFNGSTYRNDLLLFLSETQFIAELDVPQLVGTISPITLKALIGQNNIWSNANGNIDVRYWKH